MNYEDEGGFTPLAAATSDGHLASLNLLIAAGEMRSQSFVVPLLYRLSYRHYSDANREHGCCHISIIKTLYFHRSKLGEQRRTW